MRKQPQIPSRAEAISSGLAFYGVVSEVYCDPSENPQEAEILYMLASHNDLFVRPVALTEGEVLGTVIKMISLDSDKIVLASFVGRTYHRSKRSYERHVKKAVKQDAATIRAWNGIPLEDSLLLEAEPDAGTKI